MFGGNGNKAATKPQSRIDCLIGAGTSIEGNVVFTGGLRVDGHVRGNIFAEEGKPGTRGEIPDGRHVLQVAGAGRESLRLGR